MHLRSLPAAAASQQAVAREAEGIEFEYAASFARVIETRRKRAKTPRAGHEDENSSFTETTTTTQISTTQRVALARHNSLSRLAMHVRGQTPELVQEFDSPAKLDRLPSESKSVRREASWKGSFRGTESSGPNARIPSLVEERGVVKDEGRGLSVRQKLPTSSIDQAPRAGPRAAITPLSKDKHRRLPQNSHRLERTNTAPAILPNSTIEQLVKDLPTMDPAISMQDDKFCETMCFRCNTWFENAFLDGRIGACLPVMNCAEQLLQTALSAKSPNAEELALRTWTNLGSLYERTKDLKKALFFFNKALVLAGERFGLIAVSDLRNRIATAYTQFGEHEAALEHATASANAILAGFGVDSALALTEDDIVSSLEHSAEAFKLLADALHIQGTARDRLGLECLSAYERAMFVSKHLGPAHAGAIATMQKSYVAALQKELASNTTPGQTALGMARYAPSLAQTGTSLRLSPLDRTGHAASARSLSASTRSPLRASGFGAGYMTAMDATMRQSQRQVESLFASAATAAGDHGGYSASFDQQAQAQQQQQPEQQGHTGSQHQPACGVLALPMHSKHFRHLASASATTIQVVARGHLARGALEWMREQAERKMREKEASVLRRAVLGQQSRRKIQALDTKQRMQAGLYLARCMARCLGRRAKYARLASQASNILIKTHTQAAMRGAWRERASTKGKGGAEKATAQERSGARGAKERRWAGDVERNAREIRREWEGERRALFRAVEGGDGRWRDGEAQSVERMRCMSVLDELGYTEEEIQRFLEAAGDTEDEVAWAQFVRGLGMLQAPDAPTSCSDAELQGYLEATSLFDSLAKHCTGSSPSVEDCTLLLSSLSWSESATSSLAAKLNPPTIKPKRLPSSGSQRDLEQGSSFLGIVPYSTHTPSPSRSPAPSVRSTREVEVSRSLFVRSVVHAKLEEQARLLSVSRASSRQDITATTVNRSSSAINRSSSARSLRKTQQPSMRQLEATRRRDEELQAMEAEGLKNLTSVLGWKAARAIQTVWRCRSARTLVGARIGLSDDTCTPEDILSELRLRWETATRNALESQSATTIQLATRCHFARRRHYKWTLERPAHLIKRLTIMQRWSAQRMQMWWFSRLSPIYLRNVVRKKAETKLEGNVRVWLARRRLRQYRAAKRIQVFFSVFLPVQRLLTFTAHSRAALPIQRAIRCLRARRMLAHLRQVPIDRASNFAEASPLAATRLSLAYRSHLARRFAAKRRQARDEQAGARAISGAWRGHVARHVMQKHARAAREERKGEGAGVLQRAWRQRGGRKGVEERRRERERELEAGAALWSRLTAARAHRVYCHVVSGHAGAETVQWAWQARAARRTLNQVRAGGTITRRCKAALIRKAVSEVMRDHVIAVLARDLGMAPEAVCLHCLARIVVREEHGEEGRAEWERLTTLQCTAHASAHAGSASAHAESAGAHAGGGSASARASASVSASEAAARAASARNALEEGQEGRSEDRKRSETHRSTGSGSLDVSRNPSRLVPEVGLD